MAGKKQFQLEQTPIGLQYVIPGAERAGRVVTPKPTVNYSSDGAQLVIPGGEKISTGQLLARKMAEPIKPKARQRSLRETALFGAILVVGDS